MNKRCSTKEIYLWLFTFHFIIIRTVLLSPHIHTFTYFFNGFSFSTFGSFCFPSLFLHTLCLLQLLRSFYYLLKNFSIKYIADIFIFFCRHFQFFFNLFLLLLLFVLHRVVFHLFHILLYSV